MMSSRVPTTGGSVDNNSNGKKKKKDGSGSGSGSGSEPIAQRRFFRVLIGVTILAVLIFGIVETGIAKKLPLPLITSAAPEASSQPAAPVKVVQEPPPPQTPMMPSPGGWRDLKFGMTEKEVAKIILGYRSNADIPWKKSETTFLPTVRLAARSIEYLLVDEKVYHHFSIRELDAGAANVDAWHNAHGELIAIQLRGRADTNVFFDRASEAYAARPQNTKYKFFDDRTKMQQSREISIWRGTDMTAFLWTSSDNISPILLLWSNAAMTARETELQSSIDAPADAIRKAAKAGELGTKF